MGVKIKIQKNLQFLTNNKETLEVSGSTVGQCLDELVRKFPEIEKRLVDKNRTLLNYIEIFVNGKRAYPNELATPVKNGDEIFIFLMIAGG